MENKQLTSIQGEKGSFHDEAARNLMGTDIEIVPCDSFEITINNLVTNQSKYALVAIENSLFGTINDVYDLLLEKNVHIIAEIYLRVALNLCVLPGTKLQDIKEVYSHRIALAESAKFLSIKLPSAKLNEHADTAGSAGLIASSQDKSKAAITSKAAAEIYGLEILEEEIEDDKQNYTRFVLLSRESASLHERPDKTSLVLKTPSDRKPGSLYRALGVFAKNNVNLYALHSRPIIGKAWHYMFYLDIDSSPLQESFQQMLDELSEQGCEITILGSYKSNML